MLFFIAIISVTCQIQRNKNTYMGKKMFLLHGHLKVRMKFFKMQLAP